MASQRQPRQVQYSAPQAQSSSFIEMATNSIARGLGALQDEFRIWSDNIYDSTYPGMYGLGSQILVPTHPFNPRCIFDISHHNGAISFAAARSTGQLGVIIKATDALVNKKTNQLPIDRLYETNYRGAVAAGLLVGSYHFGRDYDGVAQADHFLSVHQTGIMVLDFERPDDDPATEMKPDQAEAFVQRVYEVTGQYPGIYADRGHLDTLAKIDSIVKNCWVWLAGYLTKPVMSKAWLAKGEDWTIWQYSDGVHGPWKSERLLGKQADLDEFNGTEIELITFWQTNSG